MLERPDKGSFRKGSEERGHIQEHLWELRVEFASDMYFLHIVRKITKIVHLVRIWY
jgi:hypothetical protein